MPEHDNGVISPAAQDCKVSCSRHKKRGRIPPISCQITHRNSETFPSLRRPEPVGQSKSGKLPVAVAFD